jgi:3-hydroxybutyryl-CoA dehydrogenase
VAQVSTVAVIGAGALGRGIAHAAALAGYRTIVEDLLPSSLRKAESEFRASLEQAIASGRVPAAQAPSTLLLLEYAQSVEEAARQADLVIEAVPEELESKSEIFILLDKICRPATILVTTARTINVTQLANVTYRAPQCVGMRFVHPVHEMGQLDVVRGHETSEDTLNAATLLGERMGYRIVVIEETASIPAVSV